MISNQDWTEEEAFKLPERRHTGQAGKSVRLNTFGTELRIGHLAVLKKLEMQHTDRMHQPA